MVTKSWVGSEHHGVSQYGDLQHSPMRVFLLVFELAELLREEPQE